MNIILWGLGTNNSPLVQYLPLRHTTITFPTIPESPSGNETYVKFTGRFGTSYSDHRKLWKALKKGKSRAITAYASSTAVASRFSQIEESAADDASPTMGAFGQLPAEKDPVIQDGSKYETGHAYIPGTLRVYLNGLYQRPGIEYFESEPGEGEIEFYTPLLDTDEVFIEFRAAGSSVE